MNHNLIYSLLFIFVAFIHAQTPDIIPLSKKVGLTVDAEENIFYRIFNDIDGFYSAQFYDVGKNKIVVQIVFVDFSQKSVRRRSMTTEEFIDLKHHVDAQPYITDIDRQAISENLTYLTTVSIIESIPNDQYIVIEHRSGKKVRGSVLGIEDRLISIQTPISVETIPILSLIHI